MLFYLALQRVQPQTRNPYVICEVADLLWSYYTIKSGLDVGFDRSLGLSFCRAQLCKSTT